MQNALDLWSAVGSEPRWLTVTGLVMDAFGALLIVSSVVTSRRGAGTAAGYKAPEETGLPMWTEDMFGPNRMPPPGVADRLRQSQFAVVGGGLLILGFMLQIAGTWPR